MSDLLALPAAQLRLLVAVAAYWRVNRRAPLARELAAVGAPAWPAPALEAKGLLDGSTFKVPGYPRPSDWAKAQLDELIPREGRHGLA